jgi:hypothetical protein
MQNQFLKDVTVDKMDSEVGRVLIYLSWATQLSRNVLVDAGVLDDTAAVHGAATKERPCTMEQF